MGIVYRVVMRREPRFIYEKRLPKDEELATVLKPALTEIMVKAYNKLTNFATNWNEKMKVKVTIPWELYDTLVKIADTIISLIGSFSGPIGEYAHVIEAFTEIIEITSDIAEAETGWRQRLGKTNKCIVVAVNDNMIITDKTSCDYVLALAFESDTDNISNVGVLKPMLVIDVVPEKSYSNNSEKAYVDERHDTDEDELKRVIEYGDDDDDDERKHAEAFNEIIKQYIREIPQWVSIAEFPAVPPIVVKYLTSRFRPRNILLIGPPGTGKTTLAKAILKLYGYTRYMQLEPTLFKHWHYGASPRRLRRALEYAEENNIPTIIDDAEFLSSRFNIYQHPEDAAVLSVLLDYLTRNKVPTIIIVNNVTWLDPALIRAGRVDATLLVLYPDKELRKWYIKRIAARYGVKIPEKDVEALASGLQHASLAEIDTAVKLYAVTGSVDEALNVLSYDWKARESTIASYLSIFNNIEGVKFVIPPSKEKGVRPHNYY